MSLIYLFRDEIEQIQDERIRGFVVDALDKVPEFYYEISTYIDETKRAISYSDKFLEVLSLSDYVGDVIKSAILLQDMTRYKLDVEGDIYEDPMHPLNVRMTVMPLLGSVGKDNFDDIMRTIECSHGLNAPIPQVMPSIEDPVHIWILPFVNSLARA